MATPVRKVAYLQYLQLALLSATWLAGIYVNGFVAILPGESVDEILLTPAVAAHVILASTSAATSVSLLALAWAASARRSTLLMALATFSIVVAGSSGLAFVLGGGSSSVESMIMASAFITAAFLTFLSLASLKLETRVRGHITSRISFIFCCLSLLFAYAVFLSGIYVNLFVAGPVFSLPLNSELAAFRKAEGSPPFVIHEVLGALLLVSLLFLAASLWFAGARKLSLVGSLSSIFVAYSAYVGSINLTSPLSPISGGVAAILIPMLSAASFITAVMMTMLLSLRIRTESGS